MERWRRGRTWFAAGLVAVIGVWVWLLWPDSKKPTPLERQYRSDLACLLTDERGVTGPEAGAAWAGLRDASETTLVRSQSMAVVGEQSQANATSSLASLVQRRCGLVVAVGSAPVAAVLSGWKTFSGPTYAVVAKDAPARPILSVTSTDPAKIRDEVKTLVVTVFGHGR